ncbi:hypothetical protein GmHk_11G032458 [Glycine max]|nr:hypothetical protein GmHk_11G032458 [Glycine max]
MAIEEGVIDKRSWVRGQWIPYDEDAINQFLGHPLVLKEGQRCEFSERRSQVSGFDEEAIGQLLCSPGQDFARSVTGRRVWIMRTSITMYHASKASSGPRKVQQTTGISGLDHGPLPILWSSGYAHKAHPAFH